MTNTTDTHEPTQRTLTGDEADPDTLRRVHADAQDGDDAQRARPSTLLWCPECDEWRFRRDRHHHPHVLIDADSPSDAAAILDRAEEEDYRFGAGDVLAIGDRTERPADVVVHDPTSALDAKGDPTADDAPERVGAYYTVEIHQSVEYRFRIPAATDHLAKEEAKDRLLSATPADAFTVHTEVREGDTIYEGSGAEDEVVGR
jgi:hypothetical protein